MSLPVNINGVIIPYPQTGDTGWGDNATKFAEEVASVLGKIGQSQAPVNDDIIVSPGNLSVTSGDLSVGGNASVTGNTTLTGNITVNGNSNLGNGTSDTIAITGILNVDSGVLYVDPTNSRVGINDATPSVELDVNGAVAITGNTTVDGVIYADDNTTANTPVISFTGDTNTGIGRSAADTLDFITNGISRARINSTGQQSSVIPDLSGSNTNLFNEFKCRAWVNFDGTTSSPSTIRGSGNVTSIIRNSSGDYTINFTTAMPDENYSIIASGGTLAINGISDICVSRVSNIAGSCRVETVRGSTNNKMDFSYIGIGIFR